MLAGLPIEILLMISRNLDFEADINALAQVNCAFYSLFKDELYHHLRQILAYHEQFPFSGLAWTAKNGNADSVRRLLNAGVPPDTTNEFDAHPVILAAEEGHADVIRAFLEHQARLEKPENLASKSGPWQDGEDGSEGPFAFAFYSAALRGHDSVVKLLLGNIDFESLDQMYGRYFLDRAVDSRRTSAVKLVLEMGCVRWSHDQRDKFSLIYAAAADIELFRLVFDAAPECLLSDSDSQCKVFSVALRAKNFPVATFLKNKGFDRALLQSFELLDEYGYGDPQNACYHLARVAGDSPDLGLLLLGWIDVGAVLAGKSLHIADIENLIRGLAAGDFQSLLSASLDNYLKLHDDGPAYQDLLDFGLNHAVFYGHRVTASLLLDRGADSNVTDPFLTILFTKDTALTYAVSRGHLELIELLLDRGADSTIIEPHLLDVAMYLSNPEKCLEVLRLLSQRVPLRLTTSTDYSLSALAADHGNAIFSFCLDYFNFELDSRDIDQREAFISIGEKGDIAMLKKFLDAGFDANLESFRRRPLNILLATACAPDQKAAENGVRLLLQYGANIHARDSRRNRTLLQILVSGDPSLRHSSDEGSGVRILSRNGADLLDIKSFEMNLVCMSGMSRYEVFEAKCFDYDLLNIASRRYRTEDFTAASMVKILLECFEERCIPFGQIKDRLLVATGNSDREISRILWKYYWRRVYPVS